MKKISLIVILFIIHINAYTQKKFSLPFSSFYDENAVISFGIQYNYVYQNYQLRLKDNWQQDYPIDYPADNIMYLGDLKSIRSKAGSGFSVGIPIDLRMSSNIYLSTVPSFLFVNNLGIEYQSKDTNQESLVRRNKHQLSSTYGENFKAFEIPLHIKFRSDEKVLKNKTNRYRAYIISGIRYSKWLGINKYYKDISTQNMVSPDPLILKSGYLSWEAGIGLDIFFEGVKISPEIKFNQSFNTVFDNNNALSIDNKFMNPIEKALIRNIYLGLIFQ